MSTPARSFIGVVAYLKLAQACRASIFPPFGSAQADTGADPPRRDRGRNGIGRIVEAIDEIEDEGDGNDQDEREKR